MQILHAWHVAWLLSLVLPTTWSPNAQSMGSHPPASLPF